MRSPIKPSRKRSKFRWGFRPALEALEARLVLAQPTFAAPPVLASANGVLQTTLTQSIVTTDVGGQTVGNVWTYNGSYAAPALEVQPGDLMNVTLNNQLPEPTNLHTHGLHVSPEGNSDNVLLEIDPGQQFEYNIQLPSDHPEGLYWYHPHDHGFVNDQISQGLSGMLVVGQPDGGAPELNGLMQQLIELKNAQIANGQMVNQNDGENPAAQVFTVNGQLNPLLTMRPGEQQVFNVANIGNNAFYDIKLVDQDGQERPLYEVAEDGNPFTQVVPVTAPNADLGMPPGRRWSFLIQGGQAGQTWTLQTAGFNDGFNNWPPATLMTITFQGTPVAPAPIPTTLTPPNNPYVDLRQLSESQIAQQRTVEFEQGPNAQGDFVFEINGAPFPDNPVFQPQLNTVEEWTITNPTTEDHAFHLHTNPVQVISASPGSQPKGLNNWQDVVNVPHAALNTQGQLVPGKVVIRVMFRDYIGANVYHCHLVDHEDMGMMALSQILPATEITAVGSGPGGPPQVSIYNAKTHALLAQFLAFGAGFTGGVHVAVGDVNHDGIEDVIVSAGAGGGPDVKVYNGATNFSTLLYDFFAFNPSFTGGVNVAAADINADGYDDVVCGAGAGGGPAVYVYSGQTGAQILSFFAYNPAFTGGVTVAAGDLIGNGRNYIVTGAGSGGGPVINVYNDSAQMVSSFFAFDASFTGGVNVATGRVLGIGFNSILVGAGPGGGPVVSAFGTPSIHDMNSPNMGDSTSLDFSPIESFFAFDPSFTGGVSVSIRSQSLGTNFLVSPGAGGGPVVAYFDGVTHNQIDSFFAGDPTFSGGINASGN